MAIRKDAPSPWRKAVLVPCWVAQVVFGLAVILLLSLELGSVFKHQDDNDNSLNTIFNIVASISIGVTVLNLVSVSAEIVLFRRQNLKPKIFLAMNFVKSLTWTILFTIDTIVMFRGSHKPAPIASIIFEFVLLLNFYMPLVHSILVYRHDGLSLARAAVDAPLMIQAQPNPHFSISSRFSNTSYETYASLSSASIKPDNTLESQPTTYTSLSSINNASNIDIEDQSTNLPPPQPESTFLALSLPPQAATNFSRRPSYDHSRDIRFEQYLARRASSASSHRISDVSAESVYSGSGTPKLSSAPGGYTCFGRMGAHDQMGQERETNLGLVRQREEMGVADCGEQAETKLDRNSMRRKSSGLGLPIIIAIDEAEEER